MPQRQAEAEDLIAVADSCNGILTPSIGFAASLIVVQVVPSIAIRTVVFPHRTPGARTEIWAPTAPGRHEALKGGVESFFFLRACPFGLDNRLVVERSHLRFRSALVHAGGLCQGTLLGTASLPQGS